MSKVRNVALVGVSAVVLCAALGTRVVDKLLSTGENYSYLEGRSVTTGLPPRTLEAFASGEFQDGFESFASDALPGRGRAMLANAWLQEVAIKQAGALFGYDALPTYYGSERLYVPSQDAVTYLPHEASDSYYNQKLSEFAEKLAGAAARYPEKRFVVYVVQGYQEPAANPAYGLMSSPYLPESGIEVLRAALTDCPNVAVLTNSYDSLDAYYQDFFRSDHHWNIQGALRGYNTIAAELGLEQVDTGTLTLHEVREGYRFTGATSRWGRYVVADEALDADIDYSSVTYNAGGTVLDGNNHDAFEQYDPAGVKYAFYDAYYNAIPDGTIAGPGEGNALLISNSYGGAVQRQLATQYATLDKSVALWPGYEGMDLDALISQNDAQDVVLVANITDYIGIVDNLPDFFG